MLFRSDVEKIIRWYINNSNTEEIKKMGMNGRKYLEKNLTKDKSVKRYMEEILKL